MSANIFVAIACRGNEEVFYVFRSGVAPWRENLGLKFFTTERTKFTEFFTWLGKLFKTVASVVPLRELIYSIKFKSSPKD